MGKDLIHVYNEYRSNQMYKLTHFIHAKHGTTAIAYTSEIKMHEIYPSSRSSSQKNILHFSMVLRIQWTASTVSTSF